MSNLLATPLPPAPSIHDADTAPGFQPVIDVRGLTKAFDDNVVVANIHFSVAPGRVVGFIGPSGSGKTTTIRMLLGLVRPDGGEADVLGQPITRPSAYLARVGTTRPSAYVARVGTLLEGSTFYDGLTGRDNLRVLAALGAHPPGSVDAALREVGLDRRAGDMYRSYSPGMRQRLGIAGALLPDPDLLILDEPTQGLNPAGVREIRALLRRLTDRGKSVFLSSDMLAEIQAACDDVVIIQDGRLRFSGSLDAFLNRRQSHLWVAPEHAEDMTRLAWALAGLAGVDEVKDGRLRLDVGSDQAEAVKRRAIRQGIGLAELRPDGVDR